MNPDIILTSHERAARILASTTKGAGIEGIVSIGDVNSKAPFGFSKHPATHKLRLVFDDVDQERLPAGYVGCTEEDIQRLIGFATRVEGLALVHCAAGISRSSAASCIIYATRTDPGREEEAVEALRETVRYTYGRGFRGNDPISPNRRMIDIADHLLGREGRLLDAVLREFRDTFRSPYQSSFVRGTHE